MQEKNIFNQQEYIKEYNKNNYKKISIYLKNDEFEELNKLLKENNLSKNELFKIAFAMIKNGKIKKDL